VLGIHFLGDALSPIVIGKLVDSTGDWNLSMLCMSGWLVWGVIFYSIAYRYSIKSPASAPSSSAYAPVASSSIEDRFDKSSRAALMGSAHISDSAQSVSGSSDFGGADFVDTFSPTH
jgi:hypothetical protein